MENPKHVVVVGCLVSNDNGEVLLIRHHKRGWEIPQGRVEEGECLLAALHREVREETGVEIDGASLAAVWAKLSLPPALIFTYRARYRGGTLQPSDESPELGWFSPSAALSLITHPVTLDRFTALAGHSGPPTYRSYTTSPYRVITEAPL